MLEALPLLSSLGQGWHGQAGSSPLLSKSLLLSGINILNELSNAFEESAGTITFS